jgi:prevent-host-death family protein
VIIASALQPSSACGRDQLLGVRGTAEEAEVAAAVQLGVAREHRGTVECALYILQDRGNDAMKTMAASEARQSFAELIDAAAREPVVIRRQQRDVAVVVSMQQYERLTQLNRAEFQRFCDVVGQRAKAASMNTRELAKLLRDERADA